MRVTNAEKETVIIWNEKDSTATIFTYNKKLKDRLRKMPNSKMIDIGLDESEKWEIPKKSIHIYERKISEEQRKRMSEIGKKLHSNKETP